MATVITARCTLDQHLPPLVSVLALARPPTTKNFPAVFQSFLIFFKNSWKTKNLGSKELDFISQKVCWHTTYYILFLYVPQKCII